MYMRMHTSLHVCLYWRVGVAMFDDKFEHVNIIIMHVLMLVVLLLA